ncbi:hypothetical protein JJB07_16905 [Tumebacillus sp. ITR2]|uniref:Uncharacterized protein n=1 Tax=Tumebacillus amylolyticus TaxID=2801339 RepID=A0ABS1JDD0_9BACL|nr:hypothetical protein [Tumebacillus amylolyticus]MBL0388286.1 hypothetical protein [Tumebacillus amylolyticus]
MIRKDNTGARNPIQTVYRSLDVITVVLLLTGQITIGGVFFFQGGGFSISLFGPITGAQRSVGVQGVPGANVVIDLVDLIAAFLLITDQVNVVGTLITANHFTIVISGPPFGEAKRTAAYPLETQNFFSIYKDHVAQKCKARPL